MKRFVLGSLLMLVPVHLFPDDGLQHAVRTIVAAAHHLAIRSAIRCCNLQPITELYKADAIVESFQGITADPAGSDSFWRDRVESGLCDLIWKSQGTAGDREAI